MKFIGYSEASILTAISYSPTLFPVSESRIRNSCALRFLDGNPCFSVVDRCLRCSTPKKRKKMMKLDLAKDEEKKQSVVGWQAGFAYTYTYIYKI